MSLLLFFILLDLYLLKYIFLKLSFKSVKDNRQTYFQKSNIISFQNPIRIMKKILFLLVLLPIMVVGQTQTENYIKNTTYKVAITTSIATPTITQASQNITYFDGLGRPIQQVAHQQSVTATGTVKDIVTPIEYDAFGRQAKEYLPYVPTTTASLDYKTTALTDVGTFYNTATYENTLNPFSQKEFEPSPLNRVLKQAASGNDWALGNGHEIKLDYQTNTASEVKLYTATATWNSTTGVYDIALGNSIGTTFYNANQLYKTITYDENSVENPIEFNGANAEFKNKEGQIILKRTHAYSTNATGSRLDYSTHDTYYIYDQYGNLTYVLPPLVNTSTTITQQILGDLGYQYKYDHRNRLVEKKLPGKQWEFVVYDKLDRPVATGPANSPFGDSTIGWLITKYDVLSRVVYTGWYTATVTATTRFSLQNDQNNLTTANYETKSSSGNIDGISAYYSNVVVPTSFKLLTVNYYDDYNFPNAPSPVPASVLSDNSQAVYYNNTQKPIGLPTGSWVRVLQTPADNNGESSYILYDSKARPVRTFAQNYFGSTAGYTYTDTKIDFSGKVLLSETKHKRLSTDTEIKTTEVFTYSPQDRLLSYTHQINADTPQLLAENTYDELGQLTSKKVGNNSTSPLQKVDYFHNIRGWLTGINNISNLQQNTDPKDLFAFMIAYNNPIPYDWADGGPPSPIYNGNISETFWKTASDNLERGYQYGYDTLNRLTVAIYGKSGLGTNSYNEGVMYDKNGNITLLGRNGDSDNQIGYITIDNLRYTYAPNSNKLLKVTDDFYNTSGFKDGNTVGDDYDYDANGNMTIDRNKGIINGTSAAIIYNHLNLPTKITFGATGTIEYLYDANGKKLEKLVTQGTVATTTKYLEGFQYTNDVLQYFPTAEGYVSKTGSSYKYVFNYTDHLGNIRLSYAKNAITGVLEIMEENNYYPFGLKHKGYNDYTPTNYKYKFQGQERQDELGLNWDSFKWRNYDPAIGRFMCIDPLAEKYPYNGVYNFSENRVIDGVELEGLEVVLINPDRKRTDNDVKGNKSHIANDRTIVGGAGSIPNSKTNVTVTAHANPGFIQNDGGENITNGAQFNKVLNETSDAWKNRESNEGMTVTIYACRTGSDVKNEDGSKKDIGIAQKISGSKDFKGVLIIAPDQRVYFDEDGPTGTYKAENSDKNDEYKKNSDGSLMSKERSDKEGNWNMFMDGKKIGSFTGKLPE